MVIFIHTKDLYVLQVQFCTGPQAQFRTGPLSPVLFGPSPALPDHQAQLLIGPPSPVPYWPTKPSFALATKLSSVLSYQAHLTWPAKPISRRLGLWTINMGLQIDEGLLVSFVNSEFRDLVRVKVSD